MDTKLIVSASPHVRSDETTQSLMANVIVALCPCVVASAIIFGVRALLVTAVSVVACVVFEWLYCKLLKRPNPISDLSAVVTGIILAMNVPVGMPIGQLIIGDLVAIIVVKQLFGGIGMNFANPALVGRIVLFISFAGSSVTMVTKPSFLYLRKIIGDEIDPIGKEFDSTAEQLKEQDISVKCQTTGIICTKTGTILHVLDNSHVFSAFKVGND